MEEKRGYLKKILGTVGAKLMKPFTATLKYDRAEYMKNRPAEMARPKEYDVRGMKVNDSDLDNIHPILYGEVSNRPTPKQEFETRLIANVGLNRMAARQGKTLTDVFQEPYQFQGYAPKGVNIRGKVVKSEYQRVKENDPSISQKKMEIIRKVMDEIKTGQFKDTTGGAQFYVHATDGTIWLGKTLQEAKNNARAHENNNRLSKSRFGTTTGLPAF